MLTPTLSSAHCTTTSEGGLGVLLFVVLGWQLYGVQLMGRLLTCAAAVPSGPHIFLPNSGRTSTDWRAPPAPPCQVPAAEGAGRGAAA